MFKDDGLLCEAGLPFGVNSSVKGTCSKSDVKSGRATGEV